MTIAYDPRSQTIRVNHTLADYKRAVETGHHGIVLYSAIDDNLDDRAEFRHEYAHFASYHMTGLSEFHALFLNYKLFLLCSFISKRTEALAPGEEMDIPLIPLRRDTGDPLSATMQKAFGLVAAQEALFFGHGTNLSIDELFDIGPHLAFYGALENSNPAAANPNLARYLRFLKQMRMTTPPQIAHLARTTQITYVLEGETKEKRLSSRAVQEAYALTIEVVSQHIAAMRTSLNTKRVRPQRFPAEANLRALEVIFDGIYPELDFSAETFLGNGYDVEVYWSTALLSFVAQQVPVLEDLEGDFLVMGSLKQLAPHHRLVFALQAIEAGALPKPEKCYLGSELDIMRWIDAAHRAVGDPWSIKFYQNIAHQFTDLLKREGEKTLFWSMHSISLHGRQKFISAPKDCIWETGLWSGTPLQVWYVRTRDEGLLTPVKWDDLPDGSDEKEALWFRFAVDQGGNTLEALVFEEAWASVWIGLDYFHSQEEKTAALTAAFMRYVRPMEAPPQFRFRQGYL